MYFNSFFFKQKTAYEMRISDWSSDVCSSDLSVKALVLVTAASTLFNGNADYPNFVNSEGTPFFNPNYQKEKWEKAAQACREAIDLCHSVGMELDRKSVVWGKSVSVRVDLGGRGIITKKKQT